MVEKTTIEEGDAIFCKEVQAAISQAKIPPAPDEQTWQKFSNVTIDFKP